MNIGPIVRVLEDVPSTIPLEREPAGAPAPLAPGPLELPQAGRGTALVVTSPTALRRRQYGA